MAKKRVYEIAKERGLSSKELIETLRGAGVDVKAPASTVDEEDALRVLSREGGNGDGRSSQQSPPSPNAGGAAGGSGAKPAQATGSGSPPDGQAPRAAAPGPAQPEASRQGHPRQALSSVLRGSPLARAQTAVRVGASPPAATALPVARHLLPSGLSARNAPPVRVEAPGDRDVAAAS